ncbi:MAG: SusD/RagB family nutrient-binding outer membrane lipoprotein [Bacteroidales bacterium]|nr:SusD/RagB family nutrient-binding outer membrane lipoprotein [Bacteroidales bacterium]
MKKVLFILGMFLLIFPSCQKELEEQFKNPMVYTPPSDQLAPGLFTKALTQWKFYIMDYGEYWWQFSGNGMPEYSQVASRYITPRYSWYTDFGDLVNGNGFDQSGFNWFNDYYTRMRNWGILRDLLADMQGKEYDDNVIYFKLTSIIKDWGALRNIDLYNSIPYKDAFNGTHGVFFVPYDDPKETYESILDDLKSIADELPSIYSKMSPEAKSILTVQDLALKGDVTKWVQYANALRLKYAVKLSGIDEAYAKTQISDAIQNLPQEDLVWDVPFIDPASSLPGGGTFHRGLYERAYCTFIPNIIMNRMNIHDSIYEVGIDDPRLPVIALPTKYNDYRGVSLNADAQEAGYNAGDKYYPYADDLNNSKENNSKSMYSMVTITHNNTPADMMTLGEVDLFLAEAAAKNLATTPKTAGDYVKDAIINSTNFWYSLNATSEWGWNEVASPWDTLTHPTKPDASLIAEYADKVKAAFDATTNIEDKMEIIMIQKYIHLNVLRPYELFDELRRTRHPKIEKMTFQGVVMAPMVERLKYPTSEVANNYDNYQKVADQDNWTTPIFWVTDSKKNETYYRDDYVPFNATELPTFK